MSERKVLNKYYPPDFDPSKIPRMKLAKNRQYTVRLMAPFNMRCKTCGEYIYKGKKFNARKEDVENETYLGIRIYRFYIKCTRCLQEISFKTDPQNTDYEIEAGATRNFMALKLAEEQARREEEEAREEEANNPMKLLENRTQQSRNEIEMLESLEELRDLNRRQQAINYDSMLMQYNNVETERERLERQEREDEEYVKSIKFRQPKPPGSRIVAEEVIEEVKEEKDKQSNSLGPPAAKISKPSTSANVGREIKSLISIGASKCTSGTAAKSSKVSSLIKRKEAMVIVKPKQIQNSDKPLEQSVNQSKGHEISDNNTKKTDASSVKSSAADGLSLLSAYSDSSEDTE